MGTKNGRAATSVTGRCFCCCFFCLEEEDEDEQDEDRSSGAEPARPVLGPGVGEELEENTSPALEAFLLVAPPSAALAGAVSAFADVRAEARFPPTFPFSSCFSLVEASGLGAALVVSFQSRKMLAAATRTSGPHAVDWDRRLRRCPVKRPRELRRSAVTLREKHDGSKNAV